MNLNGAGGLSFTGLNISTIDGAANGIRAINNTAGALNITTDGSVNGNAAAGISAYNSNTIGSVTDLTINANSAAGGARGIYATNTGNGTLSVTSSGTVTGGTHSGIKAFSANTASTTLEINSSASSNVTGGLHGIYAVHNGTGTLSVTALGDVTGGTGAGISTRTLVGRQSDIDVLGTATVTSGSSGIAITNNDGNSLTRIGVAASVTGAINLGGGTDSLRFYGAGISNVTAIDGGAGTGDTLFFRNASGAVNGPIAGMETVTVEGASDVTFNGALSARLTTIGSTTVTLNSAATVSNTISNDAGNSTVLVKNGASVTGAIYLGTGTDSLTFDGGNFSGVTAFNGGGGTGDSLTFKDATGTVNGHVVGMETVTVEGASDVTFNGALSAGVTTSGSTTVTLNSAATVSNTITNDGGNSTVLVKNGASVTGAINLGDGTDSLTFDGGDFSGVTAFDGGAGTGDSLTFKNVTGTVDGSIVTGMESLTVDTGSAVTLTGTLDTEQLTISSATTTNNFEVTNTGIGELNVDVSATLTGISGSAGIKARNYGTHLTITAGNVASNSNGIFALQHGAGALTITASTGSTVTGADVTGIAAYNYNGTDLNISAYNVTGNLAGIVGRNLGTDDLTITSNGSVTGTSSSGANGILAINNGKALMIDVHDVSGSANGIHATNHGAGTLSVTVDGAVTGGSYGISAGIATFTGVGKESIITLNSGANVSAASDIAITNDGGNSTVLVKNGASVTGAINLGDGTDSLTFDGGDFSGVTVFDGGAGTGDSLTFRNATGTVSGSAITGMENVTVGTAANVTFGGTIDAAATVDFGAQLSLNGTVTGTLANNGTFTADGLATVSGQMTNIGDINVATGKAISPDGNLNNFGGVNLTGGSVTGSGTMNNFGTIQGKGAVTAQLSNSGQVFANGGGVLSVTNLAGGTNSGEMRVQTGSSLNTGAMNNASLVVGAGNVIGAVQNDATIRAEGGTLRLISAGNTNTASGVIEASTGNTVQFSQGLANNSGLIALTGGAFDNNGNVLTNAAAGRIEGRGTVRTGGLTNEGQIGFTNGTSDLFGTVQNSVGGRVDINDATVNFFNEVTNFGTLESNRSTVSFLGGFVNNGTLITDPNVINFTDWTNNDPAATIAFTDDAFVISNDVLGDTSNNTVWDTDEAILRYVAGTDNDHTMQLYGIDLGVGTAGLVDNFAWGTVDLTTGQTLTLDDIKADGQDGALYLDTLILAGLEADILGGVVQSIFGNGFNIYYNADALGNSYLSGLTYDLMNGGQLIAMAEVPEPGTLILFGAGVLGLMGIGRVRRRRKYKEAA
jgi:hypothetical protein